MSFMYEYMSEDELEFAIECAVLEKENAELDMEYEILAMEHSVRLSDIEVQALVENYTADDLENMYSYEMTLYTESVKDWWEKFKAAIKKFFDTLLGKSKEIEVPKEEAKDVLEIPVDTKESKNIIKKIKSSIKKLLNCRNEDGSVNKTKVAVEIGLGALATGGAVFEVSKILKKVNVPRKMTKEEASSDVEEIVTDSGEIIEVLTNVANEEMKKPDSKVGQIANFITSIVQSVSSNAVNAVKKVCGSAVKAIGKGADAIGLGTKKGNTERIGKKADPLRIGQKDNGVTAKDVKKYADKLAKGKGKPKNSPYPHNDNKSYMKGKNYANNRKKGVGKGRYYFNSAEDGIDYDDDSFYNESYLNDFDYIDTDLELTMEMESNVDEMKEINDLIDLL